MILSAPSASDRAYVRTLGEARDSLASAVARPLDTPQAREAAQAHLALGAQGLQAALAGAGTLSPDIPPGATSWVRDAAQLVREAVKELERAPVGLSFEPQVVTGAVADAMRRIAQAQQLVLTPPTGEVYDGA